MQLPCLLMLISNNGIMLNGKFLLLAHLHMYVHSSATMVITSISYTYDVLETWIQCILVGGKIEETNRDTYILCTAQIPRCDN